MHAGDSTPRASPPLDLAKPSPHPHDEVPRSTSNSRSNPRLGRSSAEAAVRGKEYETTHGLRESEPERRKHACNLAPACCGGPASPAATGLHNRGIGSLLPPTPTSRRGTGGLHHSNTKAARGTRHADGFLDEYRGFHRIRPEVTSDCRGKSLTRK